METLDEFDKLETDIDNFYSKGRSLSNIFENIEEYLKAGMSFSELAKRNTGRTTRMIMFLAEAIRRNEIEQGDIKSFLLVSHNFSHGTDLMRYLVYVLKQNGLQPKFFDNKQILQFDFSIVKMSVMDRDLEEPLLLNPRYYTYDDIFIDNAILDMKERKIKSIFLKENR